MTNGKVRVIEIKQSVFENNDREADRVRAQLKKEHTFLLNLMSSPGSGKTTTLKATIARLKNKLRIGVMEADIDSDVDALAIAETGVRSIQLHTGGMCHLDAGMTEQGLRELGAADLDLAILENVGNLVCPAEFDTGAVKNVAILSVPEGHDKPLKYPLMFEVCQALIINKIDVLPYFDFNMVLSYLDANGKRKQPWFPTGLPIKNNKKRAEKMLLELRQTYVPPAEHKSNGELSADMLFADYMELWLEVVRNSIEITTFSSYTQMVKGKIVPYFRKTGVKLGELQARHIQSFYLYELKTVCPNTVIHEHANIHKALKYAVKMDLIPYNPADKVERPKKQKYIADYYRLEELEQLFEATKYHPYSLLIQITAFYGLRRSEALGLRWDAIDFERNTVTIRHIVTNAKIDGKCEIVCADRAKTKSSLRSLPLVANIREKLLALKEQQKENKRICGNCYNREYDGYVFVDVMGNIFNPRNLSSNFSKLLEMKGLRHIRFHDLRHSCASLLLANDVPMKQIQEWLGHSDISTTANIYSHLDYKSKLTSANVMNNVLTLPETEAVGWQT